MTDAAKILICSCSCHDDLDTCDECADWCWREHSSTPMEGH